LRGRFFNDVSEWDGSIELSGGTAPEVTAVIPLRRLVTLRARGVDENGKTVPTSEAFWGYERKAVTDPWEGESEDDEQSLMIPFFRGSRGWISLRAVDTWGHTTFTLGKTPPTAPVLLTARVTIPVPNLPPYSGPPLLGTGGGGPPEHARADETGGRVRVRVLGTDGRPLAGVRVRVRSHAVIPKERPEEPDVYVTDYGGPTNDKGLIGFRYLPPGTYTLRTEDDRHVAASVDVTVARDAETLRVDLREPRGVELLVQVVDEAGQPVPFAQVGEPLPYVVRGEIGRIAAPVEPGTLPRRIDPYTDAAGTRTFRRQPPGTIRLHAAYGGTSGEGTVTAQDGASVSLKITVASKAAKPR
jgi:hypothetical protein